MKFWMVTVLLAVSALNAEGEKFLLLKMYGTVCSAIGTVVTAKMCYDDMRNISVKKTAQKDSKKIIDNRKRERKVFAAGISITSFWGFAMLCFVNSLKNSK